MYHKDKRFEFKSADVPVSAVLMAMEKINGEAFTSAVLVDYLNMTSEGRLAMHQWAEDNGYKLVEQD